MRGSLGRPPTLWGVVLVSLATGSVAAQEPQGKTWLDVTCAVTMQSAPDTPFIVSKVDGSYRNACTIADWPISSPTATLECEDGSRPTMELQGDDVLLDGLPVSTGMSDAPNRVSLLPKGDARLTCG